MKITSLPSWLILLVTNAALANGSPPPPYECRGRASANGWSAVCDTTYTNSLNCRIKSPATEAAIKMSPRLFAEGRLTPLNVTLDISPTGESSISRAQWLFHIDRMTLDGTFHSNDPYHHSITTQPGVKRHIDSIDKAIRVELQINRKTRLSSLHLAFIFEDMYAQPMYDVVTAGEDFVPTATLVSALAQDSFFKLKMRAGTSEISVSWTSREFRDIERLSREMLQTLRTQKIERKCQERASLSWD